MEEVNATAGQPGTSYRFTLDARDSHLRVNAGPGRTATVSNVSGGTLRYAAVDNDGAAIGRYLNLAPGSRRAVKESETAVDFVCQDGVATSVHVGIA